MPNSTCLWPECESLTYGRGFCKPHHHKSWRAGHVEKPWEVYEARRAERETPKECRWPDCIERKIKGHGLCLSHYRRAEVLRDMSEPWTLWRPSKDCEACGNPIDAPIHNQRFCSRECSLKLWRKANVEKLRSQGREHSRRRHAQKLSTQVERFTDVDVRLASGDICYLCGESINFRLKFPHPKSPTVDHVVPLSRGGSHTLDNAAMTHYVCNQRKSAKEAPHLPQQTLLVI